MASLPDIERYLKGTGEDEQLRQKHYRELVLYQLQSEWECLPDSQQEREAFVLRIMKRFRPDDWALMESGHKWKQEYDKKQHAKTLTVKERKHVADSYKAISMEPHVKDVRRIPYTYYSLPWTNTLPRYLRLSECVINATESCEKPRFSFSVNKESAAIYAEYENDYVRWELPAAAWEDVLKDGEFRELGRSKKINETIAAIEEQKQRDYALEKQARDTVMKLSASAIPPHLEESAIEQEYLRLKCKVQ
ncbi:MAG: hypothetical protein ACK502_07640 [Alphaproteobacteria bacterium]